jgi:hypothetical protein
MKSRRRKPARDRARQWLACMLSDGPLTAELIRNSAARAGIAYRTLRRARFGVAVSVRVGAAGGYWIWKASAPIAEGVHREGVCPTCGREWGSRP